MNYIGSKFKLCDFIYQNITESIKKPLNECVFCDLFAGSGAVGRAFKNKVQKLIANDLEYYSFVLNKNYIQNTKKLAIEPIMQDLNALQGVKGKIYQHYSLGGSKDKAFERLYFSDENAQKIDAIRLEIKRLEQSISPDLYFFLLASLLESADKVANTACVYGAFLKKLKKSAKQKMELKAAEYELSPHLQNEVFNENANELIYKIKGDILYLDPPYNAREYGANYHLLNTIALYDDFTPLGKTGLRAYQKSDFCKKASVLGALEGIIKNANFQYIFLSYNDEGLLGLQEIENLFTKYGNYKVKSKVYQRFKADSKRVQKQDFTREYLHILEKK